jgi:hypothetical protein
MSAARMQVHMSEDLYYSFLIRLWRESSIDNHEASWRGEVESVQTGQRWEFGDLREMLCFIQEKVELPPLTNLDQSGGV